MFNNIFTKSINFAELKPQIQNQLVQMAPWNSKTGIELSKTIRPDPHTLDFYWYYHGQLFVLGSTSTKAGKRRLARMVRSFATLPNSRCYDERFRISTYAPLDNSNYARYLRCRRIWFGHCRIWKHSVQNMIT